MTKGSFLHNNWMLAGAALIVLLAAVLASALQGGLSIELGGLQLIAETHEEGGLLLSFVRAT